MSPIKKIHHVVTRKKHALTSLSFLSLGSTVASIAGFITVVILSNVLDQNEYGNYKYAYSVIGLLGALSFTGGFRTMVIQSVSRGYDGIVAYLTKRNILLNLPMLLGALGIGGYYLIKENTLIASAVCIVAVSTSFATHAVIASAYLNGRHAYRELLQYQVGISLVNLAALILTVLITNNVIWIIAGTSTSALITSVLFLVHVRRRKIRNETLDTQILHYGKHLNVLNISSTILNNIDSVLIFQLLGSHSLALYALATPFVDRILGFLKTSYFFALPKFTELGPRRARALLYKRSLIAFIIGLGIMGMYYVVAPLFFKLFFPKYLESISLSLIFALNIPLVAISILPSAYLDSLIEIKNKYILHVCTFTTRIVSLLFFIHLFGIPGVIFSELFTRCVSISVIVLLIERHQKKLSS